MSIKCAGYISCRPEKGMKGVILEEEIDPHLRYKYRCFEEADSNHHVGWKIVTE